MIDIVRVELYTGSTYFTPSSYKWMREMPLVCMSAAFMCSKAHEKMNSAWSPI